MKVTLAGRKRMTSGTLSHRDHKSTMRIRPVNGTSTAGQNQNCVRDKWNATQGHVFYRDSAFPLDGFRNGKMPSLSLPRRTSFLLRTRELSWSRIAAKTSGGLGAWRGWNKVTNPLRDKPGFASLFYLQKGSTSSWICTSPTCTE
jgi:hypothetical protein